MISPMPNILVRIYNSLNQLVREQRTNDNSGQAMFFLPEGKYKVEIYDATSHRFKHAFVSSALGNLSYSKENGQDLPIEVDVIAGNTTGGTIFMEKIP